MRQSDILKILGSKLRWFRDVEHLTQEQVAERAGVPVVVVRRLEQGVSAPSLERLASIASVVDATLDELFTPLGEGFMPMDKQDQINRIYRMLQQHSVGELQIVRTILREMFALQRRKKS